MIMRAVKTLLTITFIAFSLFGSAQVRLFRGNSTYSSNILYTFDGRHLYRGRSTYSSDILCTFSGAIPVAVLIYIL